MVKDSDNSQGADPDCFKILEILLVAKSNQLVFTFVIRVVRQFISAFGSLMFNSMICS